MFCVNSTLESKINVFPHQYTKINKKIQTTSTKCQYHAEVIKPKWLPLLKWFKVPRKKQIINIKPPKKTWKPWKPVSIKKQEP